MAAGQYEFKIEQGVTLTRPIVWKDADGVPIDVTDFTARLHVRKAVGSATTLLELTSPIEIVVGTTDGKFTFNMTEAETAALTFVTGRYDLEVISPGGIVTRLLEGKFKVSKEVTRP